ncbi:MAG TPA: monovalent cation/H+ antiporter subunit D, partial [Methylophaga sp.]|nr:monovalent cation/H+ antiporter subunit D [Methylophaga sp.]
MNQFASFPVLLPLIGGITILLAQRAGIGMQRLLNLGFTLLLLLLTGWGLQQSLSGDYQVILLGDWQAPFGIVMVLDRLSAMMLFITAVLASAALWYAMTSDTDKQ